MKTIYFSKRGEDVVFSLPVRGVIRGLENGEYSMVIQKRKRKRSLNQNRLMWMWMWCIYAETGTPANDVYDYYCAKYLSRSVQIGGKEVKVNTTSSKLDTGEMTQFLAEIQADAASELGITLPSPEDLYYEEFEREYSRYL